MPLQVKYSLTDRSPETSGLLAKCKELDVTLIAHSPLAQGLLTGGPTTAKLNHTALPECDDLLVHFS